MARQGREFQVMICRHRPGDPDCGKTPGGRAQQENEAYAARGRKESADRKVREVEARVEELLARTPNPDVYEIIRHEQVGEHLVMEVRYSSCEACTFDSRKVMVFIETSAADAMYWKRIDPHFADDNPADPTHAPAPRARFPADPTGWIDATAYARGKS